MRKLLKFLFIFPVLLPLSLLSAAAATEYDGNNYPDSYYIDYPGQWIIDGLDDKNDPLSLGIKALFENQKEDWEEKNALYQQARASVNNGECSPRGAHNFQEFERYLNHYLTYNTVEEIPGEEITSENWANPNYFYMQIRSQVFARYNGSGEAWVDLLNKGSLSYSSSFTQDMTQSPNDIYGVTGGVATYSNGVYSQTATVEQNGFNLDPTIGRAYVRIQNVYDGGEVAFYSTDPYFDVVIVQGQSVGESENKVKPLENESEIIVWMHFSSLNYNFTIFTDDFVFGGVPAPALPDIQFPQKTYIDNSTGDTITNNYYEEEKQYYNYYNNVISQIQNAGNATDFSFDMEWGLLNLPIGIVAGSLNALQYSETLEFHTYEHEFTLPGGETFTFPKMDLSLDPDEYVWLTPFRYLISLFILVGLAKCLWKMIQNIVNGGGEDNAN